MNPFEQAVTEKHRMEQFIGDVLGEGEHAFTEIPALVVVNDWRDGEDGEPDYEVTAQGFEPEDDVPLEQVVRAIEDRYAVVSKHDLPDATPEEFEAIKASIAKHGVQNAIIVDERGYIIDGRQRHRACKELGKECPAVSVSKLSADQKRELAYELDTCRKNMSRKARRLIAERALKASPWHSDRLIGRQTGLDHSTIGTIRFELEAGGEIPHLQNHRGHDGKTYRVPKILVQTKAELKRAMDALRKLGDAAPHKSIQLTRAERLARKHGYAQPAAQPYVEPVPEDAIKLFHCDLRKLKVKAGSAKLIFTDPPYPKEFLPLWADLGRLAAEWLCPGGVLLAYTGQIYLPQVIEALSRHLTYHWQMALFHTGNLQSVHPRRIQSGYKPILLYSKGPFTPDKYLMDVIAGKGKEKGLHEWQQSIAEALDLIPRLSRPGDLIVDPFGGSFTTAEAVLRVGGRRFIGCDIDKNNVAKGQQRIGKVRKELAQGSDERATFSNIVNKRKKQ